MSPKEYDPDNPHYIDDDEKTEIDGWADPEARLMALEEAKSDPESAKAQVGDEEQGIFQRLDELLCEFTAEERKLFWLVFVEGTSIAAAGREAGVGGNVHAKFKKMLDTVGGKL